jgi:methionyl-tRNA formyltransferase
MMRALLIGNETLALQCGKAWLEAGHEIAAIATRHADVADWARAAGLRVLAPGAGLADRIEGLDFDWLLSIANLDLLPEPVLARATRGAVNFHDGPLPRYAGLNAPVWAILNGETRHGVTWHLIEGGVDAGRIVAERAVDIAPDETAFTLNAKCYAAALDSFPEVVAELARGAPEARTQDPSARSWFGRDKRPEGLILDAARPAEDLARLVRALDHGGYRNPLNMARIVIGGRVFLVPRAEVTAPVRATAPARPGTILATEERGLTIATGEGALRLTGLMSADGRAPILAGITPGMAIDPPHTEAEAALRRRTGPGVAPSRRCARSPCRSTAPRARAPNVLPSIWAPPTRLTQSRSGPAILVAARPTIWPIAAPPSLWGRCRGIAAPGFPSRPARLPGASPTPRRAGHSRATSSHATRALTPRIARIWACVRRGRALFPAPPSRWT